MSYGHGRGYAAMMVEPQDARPPTEVFVAVERWLSGPAGEAGGDSPDEAPRAPGAGPWPPNGHSRASAGSRPELSATDGAVRERALSIELADERLFAVLAEPTAPALPLCAVLLNAGPQRHTGPNRMWVEIARRWAGRGVPTVRIDLSAIGDSDGDAAELVRVATLYRAEYIEQVQAVLTRLSQQGLPERFLLLGLCAGAYWSLHAALADERVARVAMLNPRALVWDEWIHTRYETNALRQRVMLASTWRKVLHGEITLARHLETARSLARRGLTIPQRVVHRGRQDDPPAELTTLLDRLRERDQRGLLMLTGKEPLRAEMERSGLFEQPWRWPNLELVLTGSSADTHTLTPLWLQREVHELVDRELDRELELLAARRAAS